MRHNHRMLRIVPFALLGTVVLPPSAGAQTARPLPPERLDAVVRYVERARSRLGLPTAAVSIATPDSVLLATGFGRATVDGAPVTGNTAFPIGSVTKTMTATIIASLAEEGRLGFDRPVESVLPGFAMRAPHVPDRITLRHLLSHRGGLRQWDGHDERAQREGRFDHLAPRRAPGAEPEYSSLNFMILGRVAEHVSGRSYGDLLHARLIDPLALSSTFVLGAEGAPADRARGHQSYFGFQVARTEPAPPRYLVPAGFVGASANDLARYGGMLVGDGTFGGVRLLDSATVAELLGARDGAPPLSWGGSRREGRLMLEHAGNARTSSARIRLLPQDGYAIAVLAGTNSGPFFSSTGQLMDGIQSILDGNEAPATWPKERLFKGALLLGTVLSLAKLYRQGNAWHRAGHPTRVAGTSRVLVPLAIDVAGAGLLLFALPRYLGVPLGTITEYFPDLGIALVVSATAGVASGAFRATTRSIERQ